MFQGPVHGLDAHLAASGKPRPRFAARAEHAVEAVSVNYETELQEAASRGVLAKLAAATAKKRASAPAPAPAAVATKAKAPAPPRRPVAELRLLYQRARRDVARAKAATAIKAAHGAVTKGALEVRCARREAGAFLNVSAKF